MLTAVVGLETLSSPSLARTPLFVGSQDRYTNTNSQMTNTKYAFKNTNINNKCNLNMITKHYDPIHKLNKLIKQ